MVFSPRDHPTGLVFLLSDATGWSGQMTTVAEHLRQRGLIVVGIDTAGVLASLARAKEDCHGLTDAFETMSQSIQKQAALRFYLLPILAGIREGSVLALAGLWQAGPETIGGVATVDFEPTLSGAVPLCADPPPEKTGDGKAFLYFPPRQLFGWWQAAWTDTPSEAARRFASAAGAAVPPIETGSKSHFAIIFSGDGGWRDLDRTLGEILSNAGVDVIGIDCLRYFWSEKSPETVAADLDKLIGDVRRRTDKARIALIGYSFGADILPAVFNRLGPEARRHVDLLSLLALGKDAHFEIHIEGWLGGDPQQDASPIAPELARIDPRLIQCVYGEEEADESGCLDSHLDAAQVVGIPGGHHFDEDYEALAQRILARMRAAT
jgi:type IV secretory pathway VirJ component